MTGEITAIYAGLTALLLLGLSAWVIAARMSQRVSVGSGDSKILEKRMRVQANCAEYAPIALILLLLLELQGATPVLLHGLGGAFLLGRVLHAFGFGRTPQILPLRQAGMVLTLMMIGVTAICLLAQTLV